MSTTPPPKTRPANSPAAFRDLDLPPLLRVPCVHESLPVGTRVKAGEPIDMASRCPAPADGRIAAVTTASVLGTSELQASELQTESETVDEPTAPIDAAAVQSMLSGLDSQSFEPELEKLESSGIAADRWASPDLIGQLRQAAKSPPAFIVCGALDLDPALPLQRTLAADYAMEIAAGAAALGKLAGVKRVIVSVPEDMSPAGIAALRDAAAASRVRLYPVRDEYPAAHPSLLVRRITGRALKPGKLPTDAGVLLFDAPAALALGRWFFRHAPMRRVPVGIYDIKANRYHLLWVPVGTRVADALKSAGIGTMSGDLRAGHLLRDLQATPEAIFAGGELTLIVAEPLSPTDAEACLRCGWCVEACPAGIHPAGLLDAAQQNDPQLADHHGLQHCIECGICSYVCPSRLPLLQSIRQMRRANSLTSRAD